MKKKLVIALVISFFIISFVCFRCLNHETTQETNVENSVPVTTEQSQPSEIFVETKTPQTLMSTEAELVKNIIVKDDLIRILYDNGGCNLPCILGITPGSTYNQGENENWIKTIVDVVEDNFRIKKQSFENSEGLSSRLFYEDSMSKVYLFYEIQNISNSLFIDNFIFGASQHSTNEEDYGLGLYGDEDYSQLMNYYSSNNILKRYGKPTAVMIQIDHFDPHAQYPAMDWVHLGYYYQQDQFYIEYELEIENTMNNEIVICPHEGFINLFSWNTLGDEDSFYTNPHLNKNFAPDQYRSIEQYGGLSLESYYEKMSSDDSLTCIEIPTED